MTLVTTTYSNTKPLNPIIGALWYCSASSVLYTYTGQSWVNVSTHASDIEPISVLLVLPDNCGSIVKVDPVVKTWMIDEKIGVQLKPESQIYTEFWVSSRDLTLLLMRWT